MTELHWPRLLPGEVLVDEDRARRGSNGDGHGCGYGSGLGYGSAFGYGSVSGDGNKR